jgi:hypothetical protein
MSDETTETLGGPLDALTAPEGDPSPAAAAAPEEPQEGPETPRETEYVVWRETHVDEPMEGAWLPAGTVKVPARTRREKVLEAAMANVDREASRIMVVPAGEVTMGVITMEQPPPVRTVKLLDPATGEVG